MTEDDNIKIGDGEVEMTKERGLRWKGLSTYFTLLYSTSFIGLIFAHVLGYIDLGTLPHQFQQIYLAVTFGVAVFIIGGEAISSYMSHKHEE